ncbi:MAG: hypothetical protein U0414_38820 [Polyangiaceae bacterium]
MQRTTLFTAGAMIAAAAATGCGEASNDGPPELPPPPRDSAAAMRAVRTSTAQAPMKVQGPLTMSVDAAKTPLVNAILYDDGGALRFAASAKNQLACDALEPAWGVHYVSAAIDAGPRDDWWFGDPVNAALIARIPYDTQSARDIHPSAVRLQIGSPEQAAAWAATGAVPHELAVSLDARRTLAQPGNQPANAFAVSGTVTAFVCPSAAELLAKASRKAHEVPSEWARVEIGERSFEVKTVLAFSADDPKNGASIVGMGFYEAENARCDNATRPLHDNGGGINGLQVEVGPIAIPASKVTWGFTQPVSLDVTDVSAGRGAFSQEFLTVPTVLGHVHFGEVDYKIDPAKDEAGSIFGWIHASRDAAAGRARVLVEGRFTAKICKKPQ